MGSRCVGEQSRCIEDEELIYAVGDDLFFHLSLDVGAYHHSMELHAQLIGKLATLGQQFLRNFLYLSTFYFAIYKNVVHIPLSNDFLV